MPQGKIFLLPPPPPPVHQGSWIGRGEMPEEMLHLLAAYLFPINWQCQAASRFQSLFILLIPTTFNSRRFSLYSIFPLLIPPPQSFGIFLFSSLAGDLGLVGPLNKGTPPNQMFSCCRSSSSDKWMGSSICIVIPLGLIGSWWADVRQVGRGRSECSSWGGASQF